MKSDLISVIVPVYNTQEYVARCIESIVNQTYRNLEIILVDDGSTDNSLAICEKYAGMDNRIHIIHKDNGGSTSARNAALAVSRGTYIGFADSDDWIEPKMYEELYHACISNDAEIAVGKKYLENHDTCYVEKTCIRAGVYLKDDKEIIRNLFYTEDGRGRGISPNLCDKLFKRALIYPIQMAVDERVKYGEDDICVYSAVLSARKIVFLDIPVYHYLMRSGSICHSADEDYFLKITYFYRQMKKNLENNLYNKELLLQLKKYMLEFVLRGINFFFGFSEYSVIPFYIPPYDLLMSLNAKKIILYGAGRVGKDYALSIKQTKIISICHWVDKNYEKFKGTEFLIESPEIIGGVQYEAVLIAVRDDNFAEEIKKELIRNGIPENKIVYDRPYLLSEEIIR